MLQYKYLNILFEISNTTFSSLLISLLRLINMRFMKVILEESIKNLNYIKKSKQLTHFLRIT